MTEKQTGGLLIPYMCLLGCKRSERMEIAKALKLGETPAE